METWLRILFVSIHLGSKGEILVNGENVLVGLQFLMRNESVKNNRVTCPRASDILHVCPMSIKS